jgi:DNA-binding transcriptional ArsR family regulator
MSLVSIMGADVLRIVFTADDLARTRFAAGPDPMWEILLSLYRLRGRDQSVLFGPWRRRVAALAPAPTAMLIDLAPTRGYAADFLTPAAPAPSFTEQLEALRRTPRARVEADLERMVRLHPRRPVPPWYAELARGEAPVLTRLADAARRYFEAGLAPYWPQVRAQVDQDRMVRALRLAEWGWAGVFGTLHHSIRWHYPVLEMDYPVEHTIELAGSGLLLQPSFFCSGTPTALAAPELPPVLAYPIEHALGWAGPAPARTDRGGDPVATVLGPTRSRLLRTVADAAGTTTDVARRLGLPPSTASRQLSALREAGLVASHRHGNRVTHAATDLGVALLDR